LLQNITILVLEFFNEIILAKANSKNIGNEAVFNDVVVFGRLDNGCSPTLQKSGSVR
jgi:hypothetical protein